MKAYIFEMYIEKAPSSMPNNSDNISHLFLTFENILFVFISFYILGDCYPWIN